MRFVRQIRDMTPRDMARDQIRRMISTGNYRRGDQLPTYSELCDKLGVSLLTVQRAMGDLAKQGLVYRLHGKGCYVGKAVASGPRPLSQVGLVFGASLNMLIREPYLNQMLGGMLTACEQRNIDLTILSIRTDRGRIPPARLASQVDAVILLGIANANYVREFAATQVPLVLVDNLIADVPVDTIVVDNAKAVHAVMQHLLQLGHRRIAYVSGRTRDPLTNTWVEASDTLERKAAYMEEMAAAGLQDAVRLIDGFDKPDFSAEVLKVAQGRDAPSAIVNFSTPGAIKLCRALAAAGIRVPQDLSLAGAVGAENDDVLSGIPFTFASADFTAMGVAAVEALERQCRAEQPHVPAVTRMGVTFKPGGTVASL